MESIVELLINAENVRMALMVIIGYCGYVKLNSAFGKKLGGLEYSLNKRIDGVETSLNKRIDGVEASLNKKIDGVEASLNKKIDGVEASLSQKIYDLDRKVDGVESSLLKSMDEKIEARLSAFYVQLKTNDFAHLNSAIEALTFTLEKNKFLEREDKEYIDSRLDR